MLPCGLSGSGRSVSPLSISAGVNMFLIPLEFNMCLKRGVALTAAYSLTDLDRDSLLQTLNSHFDVCAVSGFQPGFVLQCYIS